MTSLKPFSKITILGFVFAIFLNATLVLAKEILRRPSATGTLAQGVSKTSNLDPIRSNNLVLDRVEFQGVKSLSETDLTSALDLGAQDIFDQQKLLSSIKKLHELYVSHGFMFAEFRSELRLEKGTGNKPVLMIYVNEGKSVLVDDIEFQSVRKFDRFQIKYWYEFNEKIMSNRRLFLNRTYNQDFKLLLERTLKAEASKTGFDAAHIVRIEELPLKSTKDRVILKCYLDMGDRLTFGFRGQSVFSHTELEDIVKSEREIGLSEDSVERIRAKIEEAYRLKGYAWVNVRAYNFESPDVLSKHITYVIDEGKRPIIESIDFEGNYHFTSDLLKDKMLEIGPETLSLRHYVFSDIERGGDLVAQYLKTQGYLSSRLVTVNTQWDEKKEKAHVVIYLFEGEQSVIKNIEIEGSTQFSPEEIKRYLRIEIGSPFNAFLFNERLEALEQDYKSKGYLNAQVSAVNPELVVQYSEDNRSVSIHLEFNEGDLVHVGSIFIQGQNKTLEEVIRRELRFSEGDILTSEKIALTEKRLRRLGLFSSVDIRLTEGPAGPSLKNVIVTVEEGFPGFIEGGPGFRNDLGLRLFGRLGYANLWGRNQTAQVSASVNRRLADPVFILNGTKNSRPKLPLEYELDFAYIFPWLFLKDTSFSPSISFTQNQYSYFDKRSQTLGLLFRRPLAESFNLTADLLYELERADQQNAVDYLDNVVVTVGSLRPSLTLDLRDDPLLPSRGLFSQASFEVASPFLLSQKHLGYAKLMFRSDYHVPIAKHISWLFSFRTGFAKSIEYPSSCLDGNGNYVESMCDPRDTSGRIPIFKVFSLGGVGSIRGFEEQEINFLDKNVRGTISYVNYRTQLDFPLSYPLTTGVFVDAGNLRLDSYSFGGLRYGVGSGLYYKTPVGSVNFDVGFKIKPTQAEDPWNVYLSVGVI